MKPALFLDWDGVIRIPAPNHDYPNSPYAVGVVDFSRDRMKNVRQFVEKNDMKIVLSTAWKNDGWDELAKIMDVDIPMKLLHRDYKTRDKGPRWCEVLDWLHRNGEPEYIILDDWAMQFEGCPVHMKKRFVQCAFDVGFDRNKLQEAQDTLDKALAGTL